MITNIRINGFKSFLDFELDVPPFLALVGPNASGKSNLFDALALVADVVQHGPQRALTLQPRGSALDMFHRFEDGSSLDQLTIAVTALVEPGFGRTGALPMECTLVLDKSGEYPQVIEGRLRVIPRIEYGSLGEAVANGHWSLLAVTGVAGGHIDYADDDAEPEAEWADFSLVADHSSNSILLELFRLECATWRPYALEPRVMRLPVSAPDRGPLSLDGRNLAAVLHRLDREKVLWRLEADLAALIPGLREIKPLLDERRQEFDFDAVFAGVGSVLPRVLSDGTLRALALLAAAHDPGFRGVLAVEEVENGFHPGRVAELVRRLTRDLADLGEGEEAHGLRQVLLTSHSPALVAALWAEHSAGLRFVDVVTRIDGPGHRTSRVTRVLPVREDAEPGAAATPWDVERFLATVREGDL
ncbi:putative ATPase [Actinocorallia herbida]|uniref:Putative ATPase n=1 Tax=Actinocorallia herbida TaxID=58109 RepID=A0A3N1CPQ6_9ACTN|nr:AAA family ATPase [Actinocorallia herbida]ROO83301.1 putative ATPase [Actinocorallia herbida]